jgi:hypothetical protein
MALDQSALLELLDPTFINLARVLQDRGLCPGGVLASL